MQWQLPRWRECHIVIKTGQAALSTKHSYSTSPPGFPEAVFRFTIDIAMSDSLYPGAVLAIEFPQRRMRLKHSSHSGGSGARERGVGCIAIQEEHVVFVRDD